METVEIKTAIHKKKQESPAPTGFSEEVIQYLRAGGKEISFSEGDVIIHRGDPGTAFYVILSGEIEVRLVGEENRCLTLARMGPHASFGEMALIRAEPASADIVALSPITLLQYPAENFQKALAQCEGFRNELLIRMAQNLHDTSDEAWVFSQRAEAFNMLVHTEIPHLEPLVSKSVRMREVEKEILRLAREQEEEHKPVLISGEPGTGKLFAARKIHNLSSAPSAPFIVVDCLRLDEIEAIILLFGSSQLGAAEGHLEGFGALHLAHGGTLVLQHIDSLDQHSQKFLSCYLDLVDFNGRAVFPFVKIIATTDQKPAALEKSGHLLEGLSKQLSTHTLRIPSLKNRTADILSLARIFLKNLDVRDKNKKTKTLSENAEHALRSMRYRHNNVKELREAVEMAALFSEEGEIQAEHIFAGPKDKGIPSEFDLGEIALFRRVLFGKHNILNFLRAGVLVLFTAIILLCLFESESIIGRTANSMIWAVWEPALILSFLFIGHVWCILCPLSTVGLLVQRAASLKRPTSLWIKKYGVWLAIAGFFFIIWAEKIFHMTDRPFAAAILLLILTIGTVVSCLVYQREAWCRYLCPLGALASVYALPAALHIRARPHICSTYCTTHECYKGTPDTPGCPVFHHPLYISDGHNCKLCLKCLNLCPHGSTRLYARPILQAVWLFGGFARILSPFALAVFSLSIVMLVSNESNWINGPLELTAVALAAIFLGIALNTALPRLLADKTEPDNTIAARVSFGLLVLAWGPLMAYQLSNIPGLTSLRLYAVPGSFPGNLFSFGEVTLLVLLQLAVILFAALLAAVVFWRIRIQAGKEDLKLNAKGWKMLLSINALYVVFAIFVTLF
jgi:transcriptional regulator with AAA-type ATPase domain/polyferredoxin